MRMPLEAIEFYNGVPTRVDRLVTNERHEMFYDTELELVGLRAVAVPGRPAPKLRFFHPSSVAMTPANDPPTSTRSKKDPSP